MGLFLGKHQLKRFEFNLTKVKIETQCRIAVLCAFHDNRVSASLSRNALANAPVLLYKKSPAYLRRPDQGVNAEDWEKNHDKFDCWP